MATVYIPAEYRDLAERLASNRGNAGGTPVFSTYMHLAVFAATVAYRLGESSEVPAKRRGPEVYEEIFTRHKLDGVAYLFALHDHRSMDVLSSNNEQEPWKILEGYVARGMEIISQWLTEASGTPEEDVLVTKMKDLAARSVVKDQEALSPDPQW